MPASGCPACIATAGEPCRAGDSDLVEKAPVDARGVAGAVVGRCDGGSSLTGRGKSDFLLFRRGSLKREVVEEVLFEGSNAACPLDCSSDRDDSDNRDSGGPSAGLRDST